MTNELAIKILTGDVLGTSEQTDEAVKMAVKALSLPNVIEINVGDTISRQDAINLLKDWADGYNYIETETACAIRDFQNLPSAQAELDSMWRKHYEDSYNQGFVDGCKLYERQSKRRLGKWKQGCCSECGYDLGKDAPIASVPNYCPNCGTKMEE